MAVVSAMEVESGQCILGLWRDCGPLQLVAFKIPSAHDLYGQPPERAE
tara:strand:- start:834 stop:977 length:144 start_codon:yes stop_codon:yes gene_type:complete